MFYPFIDWVTCKYVHKRSDRRCRRHCDHLQEFELVPLHLHPCVCQPHSTSCLFPHGRKSQPACRSVCVCVWRPAPHSCTNNTLRWKAAMQRDFWRFWQRKKAYRWGQGNAATQFLLLLFFFSTNHWFSSVCHMTESRNKTVSSSLLFFSDVLPPEWRWTRPPSTALHSDHSETCEVIAFPGSSAAGPGGAICNLTVQPTGLKESILTEGESRNGCMFSVFPVFSESLQ